MHVHVSRAPLDTYTIAKMQVFINSPLNRAKVIKIAGRCSDRWAKFCDKDLRNGANRNDDRYEAINLQNYGTIEFRIFKGTLHAGHVLANIEFVEALCQWALQVPGEFCESWQVFWAYVTEHAARYSNFIAYMQSEGE